MRVGVVYTPVQYAKKLLAECGAFDAWIKGASLCDPTAGEGAFVFALMELAQEHGVRVTQDMLARLSLIELDGSALQRFAAAFLAKYGRAFPEENLYCQDVVLDEHKHSYDWLVGNPPWVNFCDLDGEYKAKLKPYFMQYGLVSSKRNVLLGSARTDLAALVLKASFAKLLKQNGQAAFFLPLSLFCGGEANAGFRVWNVNGRNYAVRQVVEYCDTDVFPGILTAFCTALFEMDAVQQFPVCYLRCGKNGQLSSYEATPFMHRNGEWRITDNDSEDISSLQLPDGTELPRQGINTCGARDVFIFDALPEDLPRKFLFPLVTSANWNEKKTVPHKWILIPYNAKTGRILTHRQMAKYPSLLAYLEERKDVLMERKGTMIGSGMKGGKYWAMFGVGKYSFAPYKVMWQAYGAKSFAPKIFSNAEGQKWQGNQAMHAFIPCQTLKQAREVLRVLTSPDVARILHELNGEGKCNWAQPGRVAKIMQMLFSPQNAQNAQK